MDNVLPIEAARFVLAMAQDLNPEVRNYREAIRYLSSLPDEDDYDYPRDPVEAQKQLDDLQAFAASLETYRTDRD